MSDSPGPGESAFMPDAMQVMKEEMLPANAVSRFSAVLAGEDFRAELNRLFLSEWHWGTPEEVRLRPFKAHRDRCTFEISGKTGSEWHSVIAKVHTVDRSDVFAALQSVVRSGFGPETEFSISQPLAYLPSLHVLFEEKIQGKYAMDIFLDGETEEQIETARRSGAWLARFHTIAPHAGEIDTPSHSLHTTRYYADQLRKLGGPLSVKSDLLLKKVEESMPPSDEVEFCPGHGSYIPEHVFVNGPRTIVIDIDEHDMADPGRDLAWYTVSLQRLGLKKLGSIRARDASVESFLNAYESARGDAAMRHVPFFKAAECLHRAHRDIYKRKTPIPQWAQIMLDEGLKTIA